MPDLLHIVPVGDDSVLNGVLQGEDTSLGLGLVNTWYSTLLTKGTDTLWEVGQRSSYFFAVKMSKATMCAFACPCLPVFDVVTSATLQGCPLIMTWLPLRSSPACCG